MDVTSVLAFIALAGFTVYLIQSFTKQNFPDGPRGLPIVGYLPMLGPYPHYTFCKLRKQFGDIYSIKLGQWTPVVINGKKNLHHILVENSDVTSSRPPFYSFQFNTVDRGPGLGFCAYNARYITMRKFTIECIRKVIRNAVGDFQVLTVDEAYKLVNALLETNGNPTDIYDAVSLYVGSCIYESGYGMQGRSTENEDFMAYRRHFREFLDFQGANNLVNLLPWMRFFLKTKLAKFHHIMSLWHAIDAKAQKQHLETFDADHLRDATDLMILKSRSMSSDAKRSVGITEGDILNCVEEMVGAGSDTLPTYLRWALLYLALNPDKQQKLHAEIIDRFGHNGIPKYEQLQEMPYTEATQAEILRIATILPLALPHYTTKEVKIRDYVIPKDTWVIPNIYSVHMDETIWDKPEQFRPERFLDSTGKMDRSLASNVMAFGLGRRSCPGEAFARYAGFLFLTILIQKCRFQTVPGVRYNLDGIYGLSVWPTAHQLIILPRSTCASECDRQS